MIERIGWIRVAAVALSAVVVAAATDSPRSAALTLTQPFVAGAACTECEGCTGGHKTKSGTDLRGAHSWCMQLVGCNGHPGCGSGGTEPGEGDCGEEEPDCGASPSPEPAPANPEVSTARLKDALGRDALRAFDGNEAALRRVLTNYPDLVHYDAARGLVRVEGCSPETVAALFPVSAEDFVRLTSPSPTTN